MGGIMQERAREAHGYFTTKQRGEDTIVVLREDKPDWVLDIVRAAHGTDVNGAPDMLPDDYVYAFTMEALEDIADGGDDAWTFADNVDVYSGELLAWVQSHAGRGGYVDDAARDGLVSHDASLDERLMAGQAMERAEVWELVWSALEAEVTV